MAEKQYIDNRRVYGRPQAILLSDNPGLIENGARIPDGVEFDNFIILSDDNRSPISITGQRLEKRERMVTGRMRSYHIADKLVITLDWNMLPSRSFNVAPSFSTEEETINEKVYYPGDVNNLVEKVDVDGTERPVKSFGSPFYKDQQYTSDGGAGGADLLNWYNNNQGSFWAFLSYDNYYNLNGERNRLAEYSEVIEVFFASFDYSIEKRGGSNHDFWNVSMSLEEV